MTERELKVFAAACARDAHMNNFVSHRGIWHCEDVDVLVVYSNHQWVHRDDELAKFRQRLAAEGITELAFGSYPKRGKYKGYTFAMVIDASRDRLELVATLGERAYMEAGR
jgi:hypothetical protein